MTINIRLIHYDNTLNISELENNNKHKYLQIASTQYTSFHLTAVIRRQQKPIQKMHGKSFNAVPTLYILSIYNILHFKSTFSQICTSTIDVEVGVRAAAPSDGLPSPALVVTVDVLATESIPGFIISAVP